MSVPAEVINPLQIMYSVSQGNRPDTSEESLPPEVPHRAQMVSLIESGWAQSPDERPSFLSECTEPGLPNCKTGTVLSGLVL